MRGIYKKRPTAHNSLYYYRYSKPNASLKFVSRKKPDKEYNLSNTPIKTHCNACDLTFATQKGIDDHYRNPKCLKVQQLKQDMEKSDNMPSETGSTGYMDDPLDKHFEYSDMCDKLLHAPSRTKPLIDQNLTLNPETKIAVMKFTNEIRVRRGLPAYRTIEKNEALDKKVKEKTPSERIKELELKLSAVSKENKTIKKILNKEQQQQLKESMNPDKKVGNHRFDPKCDDTTENPPEEGSYFL